MNPDTTDLNGDTCRRRWRQCPRAALRECARKCSTLGTKQAALGDQARHQPRRRDVEGVVGHRRALGNHPHGFDAPVGSAAGHVRHFVGAALLDRNLLDAVIDTKVDGGRRQCNIERHAIVVRGERLQVGADLVADIAIGGHPVGADDREIDHAVLHQMAAGVVRDHRMRHAVMAEFPCGERSALIARPGLVDPDMNLQAAIMREIDRRRRRAPVDRREPAGVAMGQDVDGLAGPLPRRDLFDQRQTMPADPLVDRDVLLGDFDRAPVSRRCSFRRRQRPKQSRISSSAHFRLIAVGRAASSMA